MNEERRRIEPRIAAVLMTLSWLGMVIHNRAEFPRMSVMRPEYVIPTLVSVALYLLWLARGEEERLWSWSLLAWTGMHLVIGAWLSVMPLPIWPFVPEQSVGHYLSHVIYGILQVPLVVYLVAKLEWRLRVES
jgi:hypothetical protein